MKVAIIGNPVTTISSGKFLNKFVKILKTFSSQIFILNDGCVTNRKDQTKVIPVTRYSILIDSKISIISSILKFIIAQLGFCYAIVRYLQKVRVVFVFPIVLSSLPVILCKIMGKKTILYEAQDIWSEELHEGILNKIKFHFMLQSRKTVLRCVDHIIVEGETSIALNKIEGFKSKISIIPQYVDKKTYHIQTPIEERRNIVSFIGYLDYRKGALDFAKAILLIESEGLDLSFNIIGNGPLLNEISMLLTHEIDMNRVRIFSSISEKDYQRILNETKLCILPSKAEGLPNVVLESIASGTLILATPVGAIPDLIDNGYTGFLMTDTSPESIAENIKRVLYSSNIREISDRAHTKVIRDYSFSSAIKRYKVFFQSFKKNQVS